MSPAAPEYIVQKLIIYEERGQPNFYKNFMFWKKFQDDKSAREAYLLKLKILKLIRQFFDSRGLLELEAPILQPSLIPESYLDIFSTEERRVGLDGKTSRPLYLLTSP